MITLDYHQAQAVAERATRLRKLSQRRGYGLTGTERIELTLDSPYNHPEARGGIFLRVTGRQGAPVPLFAKDIGHERDFAAARLPARDQDGHVQHPDMNGIGFDEFDMGPQLRAIGWHSTTVDFETDATHEQSEQYSDADSPDCSYWTPSWPEGEGWLMAAIYDTEDGPVALYVRKAGDPAGGA